MLVSILAMCESEIPFIDTLGYDWIFSFANEYVQPVNCVTWLVSDKWNYLKTEEWHVTELYQTLWLIEF